MNAATFLREVREGQGLSQRNLARIAFTSQPCISRYEHGKTDPTVSTLEHLLDAMGFELVLVAQPHGDPEV